MSPVLALALLLGQAQGSVVFRTTQRPVDFDRDVLPILSDHCFHCHGPDAAQRKADLRLDVLEDVLFVAEPGKPDESELVRRLTHADPARRMPPAAFLQQPTVEEVALLSRWVAEGVAWETHWAFSPPTEPAPPNAAAEAWCADPIDGFVLESLRAAGLAPAPPADRATWLRRVSLDVTGLPPSVDELAAFLADDAPGAEARVVDGLLASPRRAEHRTREWLDLARYADTNGLQNDFERHQWPWRDWVLRAFASNLPYDQFVVQQLAGDLLPDAPRDAVVATGFNRNHRSVTEGGSIDEEWRVEKVADRAETTATAFLGVTLACARCHDHKFDPFTQRDYFSFYAFFDQVDEQGFYNEARGNVPPLIPVPTPAQEARLAELDAELTSRQRELEELTRTAPARFAAWRAQPELLPIALDLDSRPAVRRVGATVLEYAGQPADSGARIDLPGTPEGHVDLGRGVRFEQDRPFTVSFWLRADSHGAVYSRMEDTDRYRGTDLVLLEDMRPAVHLIHAWQANAIKVVGADPLQRGRWHHVAVTYDGSRKASGVTLYVDSVRSVLNIEADSLDGTIAVDEPLRLGLRRYAGALAGAMHDFRVDAAVLSGAELRWLAAARALAKLQTPNMGSPEESYDDLGATVRLQESAEDVTPLLPFFAPFDGPVDSARRASARLRREREQLERDEVATVMVMRDRVEPRATRVLDRGLYDKPVGEPLVADVPAVFGALPADAPRNRLALARWLVAAENPLVARVAVNRIWAGFFGEGLVATPEDFGVRGARPEHRELLDHLAVSFVRSGWDVRALERRIALSATYRQSSHATAEQRERDPANRLLARGPRHRLDAETVRDQALFVSGLLVERLGGPSVMPYQPAGLWEELAGGAGQGPYVQSVGDDLYRRSVYTYRKRTVPHPTLTTFDAPAFEYCVARRARTNTPLQGLALLNDPTYVEAARHLAARMLDTDGDDAARIAFGVRTVLTRAPHPAELEVLVAGVADHRASFMQDPAAAEAHLAIGASAPSSEEVAQRGGAEWATFCVVAATLLNLDEAVTKR